MPDGRSEDQGIYELVCMRCRDEDHRITSRYSVGCSRVDLSKEEIDDNIEGPQHEVIDEVVKPCASHGSKVHNA